MFGKDKKIIGVQRGYHEANRYGKDLTIDYLRNENIASLNNFIRYGSYEHGRDHRLTKNKSIADILLLSDAQCIILLNFIELCRLNKNLIYNSYEEYDNDLFNKFLVSIQTAPNNLPMYFKVNNLDEEVFYYQLIRSLLKWILAYQDFCIHNGYNKLYTIGIGDVVVFNGKLKEIADIMSEYLIKVKLVYPFDLEKKDKHERKDKSEEMTKEDIKEIIRSELHDELERHHHPDGQIPPHPPKKPSHINHHYDFEDVGFNIPTLIKKRRSHHREEVGNVYYCEEKAVDLLPKMNDNDFLFLPKTYVDTHEHLIFRNMNNITIVGQNIEHHYTFEFDNTTALIQNITSFYDPLYEDEEKTKLSEDDIDVAIMAYGKSIIKIENSIFKDYYASISITNEDSYSSTELESIDNIFTDGKYGILADSPVKVQLKRNTFNGNGKCGLYVTHTNNNKSIVLVEDCIFADCANLGEEKDSAIRLINNKISSRVGITSAYVEESRFINNIVDIMIGDEYKDITKVDLKLKNNLGTLNIVDLSEEPNEHDEEPDPTPHTPFVPPSEAGGVIHM